MDHAVYNWLNKTVHTIRLLLILLEDVDISVVKVVFVIGIYGEISTLLVAEGAV